MTNPATTRQIDFLRKLDTEYTELSIRYHTTAGNDEAVKVLDGMMEIIEQSYTTLTKQTASQRIDMMLKTSLPKMREAVRKQGVSDEQAAMEMARAEVKAVGGTFPTQAAQPTRSAGVELEDGIYFFKGDVYKVIHAVHGSGNQYAKILDTEDLTPSGKARFVYRAGAIRRLRPEHKMTKEQAKEFGTLYGMCANCGATLTDERSIERAMGPVCAGKFA